jgi:hypothetical protein
MRLFGGCLFAFLATLALAQEPVSVSPDSSSTRSGSDSLRPLGDPDVMMNYRLKKASDDLADAQDAIVLQNTLYSILGADLTEERAAEMVEAAKRRVRRREEEVNWVKSLVDIGALARLRLTEPTEKLDWAKRELDLAESRARLVAELAEMARAEDMEEAPSLAPAPLAEKYAGVHFSVRDLKRVESDFESKFRKVLPVSARGETALHRSLGFDHRDRIDVALHPDDPEGQWLLSYLRQLGIPYFAFRGSVPGKATGAHIHVGPPSARLTARAD